MPKILVEAGPDVTCPRCGTRIERLDFSAGILVTVPGVGHYIGNSEDNTPLPSGEREPFPPEDRHRVQPCGHLLTEKEAAAIRAQRNAFYRERADQRRAELRAEVIGLGVAPEIADQVIETVRKGGNS